SRDEAINMFKDIGDDLKIELIADIPEDEQVTIYKQGEFLIYVVAYMCLQRVKLKYLNYLISQELIGVEIVTINNYKEFMVLFLKNKVNLMNTYNYFKKEKNVITVN